jgi:hypothetical protein
LAARLVTTVGIRRGGAALARSSSTIRNALKTG